MTDSDVAQVEWVVQARPFAVVSGYRDDTFRCAVRTGMGRVAEGRLCAVVGRRQVVIGAVTRVDLATLPGGLAVETCAVEPVVAISRATKRPEGLILPPTGTDIYLIDDGVAD
jgi:hypothetical protein